MKLIIEFTDHDRWFTIQREQGLLHLIVRWNVISIMLLLAIAFGEWPLLAAIDHRWQVARYSVRLERGNPDETFAVLGELASRRDSVAKDPRLLKIAARLTTPENGIQAFAAQYYLSRCSSRADDFSAELLRSISRTEPGPKRDNLIDYTLAVLRDSEGRRMSENDSQEEPAP